jgi:hypothetical protein
MKDSGFGRWLLRKIIPVWILCALVGLGIGYVSGQSESIKRIIEVLLSIPFCLLAAFFAYCTVRKNGESSYQWSTIERLGVLSSGVGSAALAFRLLVGSVVGPVWVYGILFLIATFVVRPVLEEIGWKQKAEPGGTGQYH